MLLNSPIFSFNFGRLSFYWITVSFRTSQCKKSNLFEFIQEFSLFHETLTFEKTQNMNEFLLVLSLLINPDLNHSCKANWYYTSERCRKLLLLIMNRTTSPCRITAGKVAILSIESFGVVNKTLLFNSFSSLLQS